MLKCDNIEIQLTNRNRGYFQRLGYEILTNKLIIKTIDLPKNSHQIVDVVCDLCYKEYILRYAKYVENESRYSFFSCKQCSSKKKKITNLERYDVDNYSKIEGYGDTVKKIKLERYGKETYNNIEKHKKTMLEKYGVEFYMNTDEFRVKSKITKNDKYQDEHFTNYEKIKLTKKEKYGNEYFVNLEKCKNTNLIKYGVDNYSKTEEFKQKIWNYYNQKLLEKDLNIVSINRGQGTVSLLCEKGHNYNIPLQLLYDRINIKTEPCLTCNPLNSYTSSGYESQLQDFIKNNYNDTIVLNDRKTIGKELDVYLPKLKLAFEFNGLYWHNELNVSNSYHLDKTELAEKNGIKLIQIYEDEWIYKLEIVKSRIINLLGKSNKVYARKCEIREIYDNSITSNFLVKNHLQGNINSKIKIGLFFNNELLALMTFGNLRRSMGQSNTKDTYEMLRFCNKLNINVIGGASRLFKYFINKFEPKELISYADRSWSSGNLYEKIGFKLSGKTRPNYSYVIGNKRHYRFNFRKDKLVKDGFDSNKTEREIMLERKIYRIYNSGHLRYKFQTNT